MKRLAFLAMTFVMALMLSFVLKPLSANVNQSKFNDPSNKFLRHKNAAPGQYIVVLNSEGDHSQAAAPAYITHQLAEQLSSEYSGELMHVYHSALKGFAAKLTEEKALALSQDPRVKFVEEDGIVTATTTETNATWGLDRIDQRSLPLNTVYNYGTTGAGVNVYIIDTGIRISHQEFGGRASVGYDAIGDGHNGIDCNGHGTHVAGTVGSNTYGVAKGVNLIAVRALDCNGSGTYSQIIAAVDWVTNNRIKPAVANMSLGGDASDSLDTAVNNSIDQGVTYVVAAGNDSANAIGFSPARVSAALTVGASTKTDARASFSNYGSVVDLFAPGENITSTWYGSDTQINTISGTSMASPHVAGAVALYLENHPAATPADVCTAIKNGASSNKLSSIPSGTANLLLYTSDISNFTQIMSPSSLSFKAVPGVNPASQTLTISNANNGAVNWSISDNASWLNFSATTGTSPSTTNVSVDVTGMAEGTYTGTITLTCTGAVNTTYALPVTLSIRAAKLTLDTGNLNITLYLSNPQYSKTISIYNSGNGTFNWSASENASWLSLSKTSGSAPDQTAITINLNGQSEGTYSSSITFTAAGVSNSPLTLSVTVTLKADNHLNKGMSLKPGQYLKSGNGQHQFIMQTDGNLVLYNATNQPIWASQTAGQAVSQCLMQNDGNLVIYNTANQAIWASGTNDSGAYLEIEDDGPAIIFSGCCYPPVSIWTTLDTLYYNQSLKPGQALYSTNGQNRLVLQGDGNLVLYNASGQALWASNTGGRSVSQCLMQADGNLVIYATNGQAIWASNTGDKGASRLVVQNDGNLVIYKIGSSTPTWDRYHGRL